MPLATTKEVIIQVDWSVEAPRFPAMVGSETLAMVVSSTWVKVPMASAKAVRARATPWSRACGFSPAAPTSPSPRPCRRIARTAPDRLVAARLGARMPVLDRGGLRDAGRRVAVGSQDLLHQRVDLGVDILAGIAAHDPHRCGLAGPRPCLVMHIHL